MKIAKFIRRIYLAIKRRLIPEVWMEPWEIYTIKVLLKNVQPMRCFEWGAGGSTLLFTRELNINSKWISVDHNKDWVKKIGSRLKLGKFFGVYVGVEIIYIPPERAIWTDENNDGAYSDLKEYVDKPSKLGMFDLMLVDGRARNDCILSASKSIEENGIVILHDANREYYHDSFKFFKYGVLLKDNRNEAGGLWFGSHGVDVYAKVKEVLISLESELEPFSKDFTCIDTKRKM